MKESLKKYTSKRKYFKRGSKVTDKIVDTLREIVDEHPEYYLDEIAE